MRYLGSNEILALHDRVMAQSGGAVGILNLAALEAALAQPRMTFGGFVDGNKRAGHAAMEVFLMLNGFEVQASVDEQERVILQVAAGDFTREEFTD